MKLILPFVILFGLNGFAQIQIDNSSRMIQEAPNCFNRYNIDYKLENYNFASGDSTILALIDLESIEVHRSTQEDVTIYDPINNVNIILFKKEVILLIEK